MNAMKRPMPIATAFFSSSGIALKISSRNPVTASGHAQGHDLADAARCAGYEDRTGASAGVIGDFYVAGVDEDFLADVSTALLPGKFAVVADLSEEWITPVDVRMEVLGGVVFVLLGLTQGGLIGVICLLIFLFYQQLENHVIQPLIIGRAVHLSPPATMFAALIGVSAGGLVGGLFAIPLLGASKAIYLSTRSPAPAAVAAN